MADITKPIVLDETGKQIITAIEQVANKIASNSNEPIHTLKYSNTAEMTGGGVIGTILSDEDFTFNASNQLHYLALVERVTLTGNIYGRQTLLGLYKDASNYFEVATYGYPGRIINVANGTELNNVALTNFVNTLNQYPLRLYFFDFDAKQMIISGKKIGQDAVTLFTQDFSSWNLTALDSFKIRANTGQYSGVTPYYYVTVNSLPVWTTYIDDPLYYGRYNCGEIRNYGTEMYAAASLSVLNWTVTSTVSDIHKIGTFTSTSETMYFGCGPTVSGLNYNTVSIFKFKITDGTDVKIKGTANQIMYDTSFNKVYEKTASSANWFEPEDDTWYYCMVYGSSTQSQAYTARYHWYVYGSGTIEVIGLCCGYDRSQNICAESYNGSYFTGAIPFSATGVSFSTPDYSTQQSTTMPVGITKYDSSGNILMFNGTAWKQINNS